MRARSDGKRSRIYIIGDLLDTLEREGRLPQTRMLRLSNLSYRHFKFYLGELVGNTFLELVREDGRQYYRLTEQGRVYAQKIRELREFEKRFGF